VLFILFIAGVPASSRDRVTCPLELVIRCESPGC
jgi:hypothetical protein